MREGIVEHFFCQNVFINESNESQRRGRSNLQKFTSTTFMQKFRKFLTCVCHSVEETRNSLTEIIFREINSITTSLEKILFSWNFWQITVCSHR